MNLPNKISFVRICMVPIYMLFIMPLPDWGIFAWWNDFQSQWGIVIAGLLFIIASVTDSIDGNIARKRNLVTDFGKFLDPVADKLLVAAAIIALVERGALSSWFAAIILGRELLITGFRMVVSGKGVVVAANIWGKLKTVFQIIAISVLTFEIKFEEIFSWYPTAFSLGDLIMIVAVILTVVSGVIYIKDNFHLIGDDM